MRNPCSFGRTYAKTCRGFKGLKQAIKLEFKLARYDSVRAISGVFRRYTNITTGCRTLQRASHLRQVRRHTKLLRKVHQQHA